MDRSESYGALAVTGLPAIRESIELAVELEGPAGGPLTHSQLDYAVDYCALHYTAIPPLLLYSEVLAHRRTVGLMLSHPQRDSQRRHLQEITGWMSALLGNLAFHLADPRAAYLHLEMAFQLARQANNRRLLAWTRGAQSMVTLWTGDPLAARDLADDGVRHAPTPLVRAQLLAWGRIRALARLGERSDVLRSLHAASRELARDPHGNAPGRFGFDLAEFDLHAAEAYLALDLPIEAQAYAQASAGLKDIGSGGWAAGTLTLARAELSRSRPDQAAELGLTVLTTVPPERLRATDRQRAMMLDRLLTQHLAVARVREFHERLASLPPTPPLPATDSDSSPQGN